MVNEERVRTLYKIAVYEQQEESRHRKAGKYYRSDYVGKEIIKSIFTGAIAYILLVALWAMSNWEEVLNQVNTLEIVDTLMFIVILFVGFLAIYLFATLVVYVYRYTESRKKLNRYKENLKVLNQMYEREEKLKL